MDKWVNNFNMVDNQTCSYLDNLKRFRKLHNEVKILDDVMKQFHQQMGPLEDAETCLSVGTGYGECDIIFAKQFLPNLKKFIAVEMDRSSVEELKTNLEKSFGSDFQVEIHEMLIEDFRKNTSKDSVKNQTVDVVLSCHSLYLLTANERMKFFESCINSWLKPETGRIVIFNNIEDKDMAKLSKSVINEPLTSMEIIESELDFFCWKPLHEITYGTKIDVSDTHEAYESMLMFNSDLTEDDFTKYVEEHARNGALLLSSKLCVFQRLDKHEYAVRMPMKCMTKIKLQLYFVTKT